MNRLKFVLCLLVMGAMHTAPAQFLQFTNLTASTNINLFPSLTNQLNSVVFGGDSNFVAVGANQIYVCGNFQPYQSWFTKSDWVTNQIQPSYGLSLDSITLGNNLFVTTGQSNAVYSATNVFAPAGFTWSQKHNIFGSSVVAPGVAYNGNGFAAVAESPEIGWSSATLPTLADWISGSIANVSFVESFRGITAWSTNGFAACGVFGDIRLSADGTNWQAAVHGQVGEADLYAIAYDGVRTLVAVGATNSSSSDNGIILVSTNSAGTNWQTVFVNKNSSTPLNAVTYTGSGFVAVGNAGQVLTSSNGVSWTVLTNAVYPANVNLYGVAFANRGNLVGVGELVGASGAVILAGTPPPSPIDPIGATNCDSYPGLAANGALSASIITDANHPAGTVTVDWYDSQGIEVAAGTTVFSPTNNPDLTGFNMPTNYTFYAVERDLRTGFISTNSLPVTLELLPRPMVTLTELEVTNCDEGDLYTLTNTLTGIGPWTITWNDGTVQTVSGTAPVILTRTVSPTNTFGGNSVSNYIYYVTMVTNVDLCGGNQPGDITGTNVIAINPRPTATLTPLAMTGCDSGGAYTLTNTLTGIGPWTITWNDGTVQSVFYLGPGPVVATRTVYPTNSLGANSPSNNVYYVAMVTNADDCAGNLPGDITGTDVIVINPRPTATLTSLTTTVCNEGVSLTLTNILTGLGPWTIYWNDGLIQNVPQSGPGPAMVTRTVYPTNTLANSIQTNMYFVTIVTNADTCAGNEPGDITGAGTIYVDPRPTATLAPLAATNCNSGAAYTLTNTLTGLGPWTVIWNDGTVQTASGFGPVILTRTVIPTNNFANTGSNSVYYVTVVTNADMCIGNQPGDITGTNLISINPLPTVTLTVATNDFFVSTNGMGTGLLETVTNVTSTGYNLTVGFQYLQGGAITKLPSQTLSITNHLAFSGLGPWMVVLSDGSRTVTTNFTGNNSYVWQETISTNFDTNFTFSVQSLTDTGTGCPGAPTNSYSVIVYDAPTAFAYTTNTTCGSGEGSVVISAALGGFGPWTNVVWSDGYTNALVTSSPLNRTISSLTNDTFAPITTNYSIVRLTDALGATTTSTNDLNGSAVVNIDPYLAYAPMAMGATNYSCPGVGVTLSVSVPANFTADWFADAGLLNNLAVGTTHYTATISAPGTNVYYVTMRYDDAFSLTNCAPDIATNIYLIAAPCTNQINSITLSGNKVVVSWSGNYILQSATNLVPPIMWMNVSTGALGPNFLTNSTSGNDFFRLYAPTN